MGVTAKKLKRKFVSKDRIRLADRPRECRSLFLDSGAHSLYTREVIAKNHVNEYNWFKSKAFRKYVDKYAKLVKENLDGIDYYANVDVIFNPELSWKVLKYLEAEHGLNPVPVIHYNTPLKWIDTHLSAGYLFLGIGGLGQEATRQAYLLWADRVFDLLCGGNPGRLPCARTHGFAMTSYSLMIRYPWWSVDSASWAKVAAFGGVYVPHYRKGKFDFAEEPYQIAFSHRSEMTKVKGKHYQTLTDRERLVVDKWLVEIGLPLGKVGDDGVATEYGVASQYNARATANLMFFQKLCEWLPEWPWAFNLKPKDGFIAWEGL